MSVTADQVEAAIGRIMKAQAEAREVCREFAEHATGWKPGDRIRQLLGPPGGRRLGDPFEVVRFLGIHPREWQHVPLVEVVNVKWNGTAGRRKRYIKIDTEGRWCHKWEKEVAPKEEAPEPPPEPLEYERMKAFWGKLAHLVARSGTGEMQTKALCGFEPKRKQWSKADPRIAACHLCMMAKWEME